MIPHFVLTVSLLVPAGGGGAGGDSGLDVTRAFASKPLSFEHRNLQSCNEYVESVYPGPSPSCYCGDTSCYCDSIFRKRCQRVNCSDSVVNCVESNVSSVKVCVKEKLHSDFSLTTDSLYHTARETSRSYTQLFNKGVDNVCELIMTHKFLEPTLLATECSLLWDLEECNSCTICDTDADNAARRVNCSNMDLDAIDNDCLPDTDFVYTFQLLKFNSSATCKSFSSGRDDSNAITYGFPITVVLIASVVCFFTQLWW